MQFQALMQSTTIAEIVSQIWCSGSITRSDRYGLMLALLDGWLSPEDLIAIDRLLHAVKRGWLTMTD